MTSRDRPDGSLAKRLDRALGKEPRKAFAKRAGVSEPELSRWLSGAREPVAAHLRKLVSALGISGHWLLTGEGMMYDVPEGCRKDDRTHGEIIGGLHQGSRLG